MNNQPDPPASYAKVDFDKVRADIKGITNVDDLTRYWMGLSLSEKQVSILKPDFSKRRKELEGENGVE